MSIDNNSLKECTGCGRTKKEIAEYEEWTEEDFENNSLTTESGFWYCHDDCFRDSQ